MSDSEILKTFDEKRHEFKPYGLTCELWTPGLMRKLDRHNEIELNYFPEGSMTYFFQKGKVTIPARRLTAFWGLVPHQIISYEGVPSYYVCTIPFSQFLSWQLPSFFVDRILKGEVLTEASDRYSEYDEFLLRNWFDDMTSRKDSQVILMEMHSRLIRLANQSLLDKDCKAASVHKDEVNIVERIAIYIAQHYNQSIQVSDIGKAVGLHPDYANAIFKKAFGCTLSDFIVEERIAHAQRRLVTTAMNITQIAFECGFNSISRFNSAFLKINGCSPREYRKFK